MEKTRTEIACRPRQSDAVDKRIARRVHFARIVKGVTQQRLAQGIGVTFQQVQKYENGVNRISAGKLALVAASLGVPINFFFSERTGDEGWEDVVDLLEDPYAVSLVRAFVGIENEHLKRAIVDHVRSLADAMF